MEIRVLFFGATADAVGRREIKLDVCNEETVGVVVDAVRKSHASLAGMRLLAAVNEEYAEPHRKLNPADRVALFTPVSGG